MSELEVIQDLFRGRVDELEKSERAAKEAENLKKEENERIQADLETANARIADLLKRVGEFEDQHTPRKRSRRATAEAAEENEKDGAPA